MASLIFGPNKRLFIGFVSIAILIEPFTPLKGYLIAKSDNPGVYLLYPFFSAGCLLALLKDRITINWLLTIVVLSLLFFLLLNNDAHKTALFYIFSSMSLLYLSSFSLIKKIKIESDISYGIYLWAFPVQQTIASLFIGSPYINILLSIIISSAFAYLSFKFIEKPAMSINKRILRSKFFTAQQSKEHLSSMNEI